MSAVRTFAVAVVFVWVSQLHADQASVSKPAGELPEIKELPNPFTFLDGSAVKTREDWQRRRAELKSLFEQYQYGHLPPKPQRMTVARGEVHVDEAA